MVDISKSSKGEATLSQSNRFAIFCDGVLKKWYKKSKIQAYSKYRFCYSGWLMRNVTLILLVFICGMSVAQASDLGSLEGLVEQWVGLRREISEEQQAWKRQELQWQREIVLLEQESRKLDELIDLENILTLDKEDITARQLVRKELLQAVELQR